jgi:hypothetical protein
MDDNEMPVASPNEAALLFAYARLVGLLDQANVIRAEAVAAARSICCLNTRTSAAVAVEHGRKTEACRSATSSIVRSR